MASRSAPLPPGPLAAEVGHASGSPWALEVEGVSKSYGVVPALNGVTFRVPAGQVVGLLGPNGAGKSTAMKSVIGILRPDAGAIRVFGLDVQLRPMEVKRLVGYVPESPALYEFLTGAEYLDFVADLYGMDAASRKERIDTFLTGLELKGHEDSLISGYSNGMKQKVALIAALAHRPRLLVLDEALNGLDPRSARVVKDLLRQLARDEGVGVLFSTHVLEIAQSICDRVIILNRGRVLAEDTVAGLRARAGPASPDLEETFLALTGTEDLSDVVRALAH